MDAPESMSPQACPPPEAFRLQMETLGIAFDEGDLDRLGRFLAILLDANQRMNLTAIKDPAEAWTRHIGDSLSLLPIIASIKCAKLIDVGAGAGLPGIPLAIVLPELQVTLLEATGKKAKFIEETAKTLELSNVRVLNDRAETLGQDREGHREQYDVVTARAVGKLPVLLELTIPFVKVGGCLLAIKGEQAEEEITAAERALRILHANVIHRQRTETGTIIVIEKQRNTGKLYPRRPGEPKRAPLI